LWGIKIAVFVLVGLGMADSDVSDGKNGRSSAEKLNERLGSDLRGNEREKLKGFVEVIGVGKSGVGLGGVGGNKGGVCVVLSIGDSTVCFMNSHLAAHQSNTPLRIKHAKAITYSIFHHQTPSKKASNSHIHNNSYFQQDMVNTADFTFWLGDLNYRIDLPREETFKQIEQKNWKKLMEHDQLKNEIKKNTTFIGFEEPDLTFPPTYKFERGATPDVYVI